MMMKPKTDVVSLFEEAKRRDSLPFLKVCAPMVRYSKSQFRSLLRKYGVEMCFTPMIIADSFCRSEKARMNDFTTNTLDTPLIMQVAAKKEEDFVGSALLASEYIDGIDLNCGCPQRWAVKDGYGCALLNDPELVHSIVRSFKNRLSNSMSVSIKIRLLKDLKDTIELCRRLEMCGLTFVSVHGRKPWQRSCEPVDVSALRTIKDSLRIPLIANGGVKTLEDAVELYESTGCDGVMAAQGILTNPALFTGAKVTPMECVRDWLEICSAEKDSMTYQCSHHHFVFMLEKVLNKNQKRVFNNLNRFETIVDYLYENFEMKIDENVNYSELLGDKIVCEFKQHDYDSYKEVANSANPPVDISRSQYDETKSNGKYFSSFIEDDDQIYSIDNSVFC